MAEYTLTLPGSAQSFDYDGTTYSGGDEFHTADPCVALAFAQSFQAANPNSGRRDSTPRFWSNLRKDCPAGAVAAQPVSAPASPPVEAPSPPGDDSAQAQGAPNPPSTVGGTDAGTPPRGTGGDAPAVEEEQRPPPGDPHPNRSEERPQTQTTGGDPIDLCSGTVSIIETDLELPETTPPLAFARLYRSGPGFYGPFGWNWDHNHNRHVRELATGDLALWRAGNEEHFRDTGAGFEPPRGVFERLERVVGVAQAYELSGPEGVLTRFERPPGWTDGERVPILWTADRHGNRLTYTYGAGDHLLKVADDDDRYIAFEYDDCDLTVAAVDNAGRRYTYEHDEESRHLVRVVRPATTDHPQGTEKRYHYEPPFTPPSLRHNLLRVEDGEGNVYAQNAYEKDPSAWEYGRVVEQIYGDYLFQYAYTQLQWVPPAAEYVNVPAIRTEVLNPNLGVETYTFNYRGDLLDRRFRLFTDGSFRVAAWTYAYDEQGNRTVTTQPDGSQELLTFAATDPDPRMRGCLMRKEVTAAAGFPVPSRVVWRGTYDRRYQLLIEETTERGATTRMRYDFDLTPGDPANTGALRRVEQPDVVLPDGSLQHASTTLETNARGQIVAIVKPDGVRDEFGYGAAGADRGRLVAETRDTLGLAISQTRARDAFGFVAQTTDGNGGVTRRTTNALGALERLDHPVLAGSTADERYHYDSDGYLVRVDHPKGAYAAALTDPVGTHVIDELERDVLGFTTRAVLASNTADRRDVRLCNDYRGTPVITTMPDGTVIRKVFDERHLPLSEEVRGTDGLRIRSSNAYDRTGRLMRQTDAHGAVTLFEYDGFGRLAATTLPNGTRRHFTWQPGDLLATEEVVGDDGSGTVRRLAKFGHTYDQKGRRVTTVESCFTDDPLTAVDLTTRFEYDALDRVIRIVDHRGGATDRTYDGLGRLVAEIDAIGNVERSVYDANGNVVQRSSVHLEPGGGLVTITRTFAFDARDRRIAAVEPGGARIGTVWDDRDLVVEQTDALGVLTRTDHDAFRMKVAEVQDAGGLAIAHRWVVDEMSRVTAYIDPAGEQTTYGFDSVGRPNRQVQPNGFSSTRVFDDGGRLVKETTGSGAEFTYTYDAANRVASVANPVAPVPIQAVSTHVFTYDGQDRLVRAIADADEVRRAYDSRGRITAETTLGSTIACRYDDTAGEVEKTWPDGRREVLAHDLGGVVSSIRQTAAGALGAGVGPLATFQLSGPAALADATYPGGTVVRNAYDDRKRVVDIHASSPAGLDERVTYRYDAGGARRVEALAGESPRTGYFEFDDRHRLRLARDGFAVALPGAVDQAGQDAAVTAARVASAAAAHEQQFTYDGADARLQHVETGAPTANYTYAPGHRIQSDGTDAYAFGPDGTLRTAGARTFDADAFGRVIAVRSGAATPLTLAYDPLGRPSRVAEAGQPVRTFNYLGGFAEQENENGAAARQLTLHPVTGVPVAYHSALGTHYALVDSRFNLLGLVTSAGDLAEIYRYGAFGEPRIFDAAGAPRAASAFGIQPVFGGQRYLAEPGLYLSKKRLMDPRHGLYLAADPRGYVDSPNPYAYAAQDPINNIDPNGDIIPFIIAAFVIGGALVGAGYSAYDASEHPDRYEGFSGGLRVLGNVFGGAAVGGIAVVAGEVVLATGGVGIFASGAGVTLTAVQSFVLYGTSAAASGAVLRGGFNSMFPEYVNPVTPRSVAFDYVTGGGIGAVVRVLAPGVGAALPSAAPRSWFNFMGDAGGEAAISGQLGPYPGKIGAWLDGIGIRQGYSSVITNTDAIQGGSWFARTDTAWHEGFHVWVARYLPSFRNLSHGPQVWAAAARYPEEVAAYAIGHAGALRPHGIPFAPVEAFNSLAGFTPGQQTFAKWFWGVAWTSAISGTTVAVASDANAATPPNEKPANAK